MKLQSRGKSERNVTLTLIAAIFVCNIFWIPYCKLCIALLVLSPFTPIVVLKFNSRTKFYLLV